MIDQPLHQLLEFSRTGAIVSSSDINVSRLFRYFQNTDDKYYFALEVVVGLMVLMHIYSELLQVCVCLGYVCCDWRGSRSRIDVPSSYLR